MGRPRTTTITWYKQFPGIRHEVAFKKIRARFFEAYGVYRELGDILAEQPEQSLAFDEDTLLWLAEKLKVEACRLREIMNLLITNGYINNVNGLLSVDSITESAAEINAEKERQRRKNSRNTDIGFTSGNTDTRIDKIREENSSSTTATSLLDLLIKEGYDKQEVKYRVLKAFSKRYDKCIDRKAMIMDWLERDGIKPKPGVSVSEGLKEAGGRQIVTLAEAKKRMLEENNKKSEIEA